MRREFVIAAVSVFVVAAQGFAQPGRGGTRVQPGQECPPGTTEVRPNLCQAPETAPPSIVDYRPKSTLVTAVHVVPKSKFPSIDFHGHPGDIASAEALERLGAAMDSIGVQTMIAANNTSGEQLKNTMAAIRASAKMKDRVRVLTGISLRDVGPGWAERAVAQLEADVAAGAVGVGEIGKGFGLSTMKSDGTRLKLDDPELKPIWDACARLGLPVFIHTADPQEFFKN
ncbi:MAG TPA: amidohydrolase family protein, partial [Gemmatimonadaceae bacterium]|nr:amidohydrolase family protein [Gemmatimonadaceae bacterium]